VNKQELAAKIESLTIFASGLSRINDFRTYSRMGRACGILATDSSTAVLHALVEHNQRGLRAFIDNNAFGTFKQSIKKGVPCAINFDDVFNIYDKILSSVKKKNLVSLVAPDVVGDQEASLELLSKYRAKIRSFIDRGADVLIPLQAGALSLSGVYRRVCQLLGTNRWRASIPCNVKRIARREIFDFVSTCRPRRIHLLGVADHKKLYPLVKLILEAHSSTNISADANHLRSIIDEEFTRTVRERDAEEGDELAHDIANYGDEETADFTEAVHDIFNTPAYLSPAEAARFARHVTADPNAQLEIIQAALRKDRAPYCEEIDYEETGNTAKSFLGQWLDRNTYGDEGYYLVFGFCCAEARRRVPRIIRSEEITRAETSRRARRRKELRTLTAQGELQFQPYSD
jgi:hypothetical protein